MNNVLFRRGDQTFIDENVPLNDGQIIFNETDEAIYVDTTIDGTVTRKRYGGGNLSRSDIDMALSTVSENPVANKVLTELMLQKADVIDDLGTALAVTENGVPTGCKIIQGLNTKINNTQQMLAPIETTLTASRSYAIGEQFIYNGLLYKTTTVIAQGDTLVLDGNYKLADSVTKQIKEFVKVKKVNATIEASVDAGAEYGNSTLKSIASEFDNYGNIYILGVPEINGVNFANFQVKFSYINNTYLAITVINLSSVTQVLHNVDFTLLMTNPK